MTVYLLQQAQETLFSFRFYIELAGAPGVEYEFTDDVSSMSIWHGEIAERIYGWSISLTGKNHSSTRYISGNRIRVARGEIDYDGNVMAVDESWYVGKILTVASGYSWQSEDWEMRVVDPFTYVSSRVSPIISTSQATVTRYATATADSYTTAATILGQSEVTGNPVLTPDRAIDTNLSTLWVSAKAPVVEAPDPYSDDFGEAHLSEIFAWPIPSLDKQTHSWLEMCLLNHRDYPPVESSYIRIMSRSGIIDFKDEVSFGEPYGPYIGPIKPRFLALCYDSGLFQQQWGQSPNHCPTVEWKNLASTWYRFRDFGRVSGRNWGFNLDGNGDYIAVSWGDHPDDISVEGTYPWGRCDPKWMTMFVEGGPKMSRFDAGATYGTLLSSSAMEIHLSSPVAANYYAGCFLTATPTSPAYLNSVRYIVSHTASDGPNNVIVVTTDTHLWDNVNFYPGYATPITPFPNAADRLWGSTSGKTSSGENRSFKIGIYGMFSGPSRWEEDRFPSVGYSGQFQDYETLPWIMLSVDDMSFVTTSPVIFGDTEIEVASSDGLTPTGYIYIDLEGPFQYSAKTSTSITLSSPYNGAGASVGAVITQATAAGASILEWPVNYISVKRKAVSTGTAGELRVIKKIYVYGTDAPSPDTPGGDNEYWYDGWVEIARNTNNLSATTLEWNLNSTARYKHYLFVIWEMNDTSQGRINEITLGMPDGVTSTVLESVTVSSFFEYVLGDLLGFDDTDIDTSGCPVSFLGEFVTDTVAYLALLSDMCRRTGTVIGVSRTGAITVTTDLGWVNQPDIDPEAELTPTNTTSLKIDRIDDRSISQVQIQAQDYQGNVLLGKYPPSPRFFGEPYREPDLFGVGNTDPNQIARYLFTKKTSPVVSCTTVGPALWINPGLQAVYITYPGDGGQGQNNELTGNWLVSSAEHAISFGSKTVPATWVTNLSLLRVS